MNANNVQKDAQAAIRVCHVLSNLQLGGGEIQVVNFLRAANRQNFTHSVVCIGMTGPLQQPIEALGIPVYVIGKTPGSLALLSTFCRIRQAFCSIAPDVIHFQGFQAGWRGRLFALTLKPRPALVYTEHGLNAWKTGLSLQMDRFLSRYTDALLSVSEAALRLRRQRERYAVERSHVMYNGVDLERFKPRGNRVDIRHQLGIAPETLVITTVARLHPIKNIPTLVRAVATASDQLDIHLLVVGDGPASDTIHGEIDACKVGDQVTMLGFRDDISDILDNTDIFCLPSYSEDLPVSILEAMAVGCPVIASRVGGIPEIVIDGETGVLFDPENMQELADTIVRVGKDCEFRRRAGEQARVRAEAVFSIQGQASRLETLYTALAKGAGH